MKTIKLLYITNGTNGSGGLERVLSIKASELADNNNYEVYMVGINQSVYNNFYQFSDKINFVSLKLRTSSYKYAIDYISGIRKLIRNINPDVISVCDDGLKGFFVPIITNINVPIIYERHVSLQIELNDSQSKIKRLFIYFKFFLMRILVKKFDYLILLTEGSKKEWKDCKKIKVIPNPLPFMPNQLSDLMTPKIIAVGKQSYQKGYDLLLKSFSLVSKDFENWELHIYGKKDEKSNLNQLVEELKLHNRVFFHDPTREIMLKYVESSIFALSSRYEGFGMVLIEAMSCGVPTVSFDCPHGPADIITDGVDGFLVEPENIEMFAEKIKILINDSELRKNMGKNAQLKSQNFKVDKIMQQWHNLFNSLTKG